MTEHHPVPTSNYAGNSDRNCDSVPDGDAGPGKPAAARSTAVDRRSADVRTVLVTGGLGFIGSAVVRQLIDRTGYQVVNVDKVTYASTQGSVETAARSARYRFHRCDLADGPQIAELVAAIKPDAIVHLAAETHVDRSIDGPRTFVQSNIVGTFNLLEAARDHTDLQRFVHVSTDEVFGSLDADSPRFDETTGYDPRSPYSASKAASDHLVRAWGSTYDLPVSVTNCSNNYGPFQFPEKLIPLMIIKAAELEKLPVYGGGRNVRDWVHVDDHASALLSVLEHGRAGGSYAIGGDNEMANIDVVRLIAQLVTSAIDDRVDRSALVEFVADRPGHDFRYAVDSSLIRDELGWEPTRDFPTGLAQTVQWYLDNRSWWAPLMGEAGGGVRQGLNTSRSRESGYEEVSR